MDDKFLANAVAKMKTDAMAAPAPAPPAAAAKTSVGGAEKSGMASGELAHITAFVFCLQRHKLYFACVFTNNALLCSQRRRRGT